METNINISEFVGKTFVSINVRDEFIDFLTDKKEKYQMYHEQDCCETVYVDDICGNIVDLLESPILKAEERTSNDNPKKGQEYYEDSFTWTFYEIATIKGSVTIKWYGESNGYYSEEVSIAKLT